MYRRESEGYDVVCAMEQVENTHAHTCHNSCDLLVLGFGRLGNRTPRAVKGEISRVSLL